MSDQDVAERLFVDFVAPLVLGGAMKPGRPIGAQVALSIGVERTIGDIDRYAHVQLARLRVARRLVPIDRVEDPTKEEWALAAALHDLVQSAHPELSGLFRAKAPNKLLDLVSATIARVPLVRSVAEALSRHTIFARMFEIARTDTRVAFWVGSRTFLGQEPPGRLLAWRELRRVNVEKTPHALVDLPQNGGHVPMERFASVLAELLGRTPLTDVATVTREQPLFAFTSENLGLLASRAGRTLALRSLTALEPTAVDTALGRATRALLLRRKKEKNIDAALVIVLALLGERTLAAPASDRASGDDDLGVARAIGAHAALEMLHATPLPHAAMLAQNLGALAARGAELLR